MARLRLVTGITGFYRCFLVMLLYIDCQGCLEVERAALLQIKDSMTSPITSAFSNWYGEECCEWEGVECDPTRVRIHSIFFHYWREQSNGYDYGEVKPWYPNATLFAQFEELHELELPGNHIGGFVSLHAFSKLKHLQKLDLRDNSIRNGSNLCWGKSPPLYYLDLSGNNLQGNIPDCLPNNLFLLHHLDLSNNQLNGYFPSLLISNLTNIESLFLSSNEFQGVISLCIFANLSRLKELDISFNHLEVESEMQSPTCSPSFTLNTLFLGGCNLKKISPWLFLNITSELSLTDNNLMGPFPRKFQNISSKLSFLDISDNFLHGTLPRDISLKFPRLRHLDLSNNRFNGNLLPLLGNQLQMLDLSENQFQGEIPHSMARNMSSLIYLRLSGNNLIGALFPKNVSLPKIRQLYLNKNQFSGAFPCVLSKSMELEIVDIQNNDLSGELSSCLPDLPKLKALLLGGNRFEGQIPSQICQMRELHVLDLSRNGLSGDIPDCVDNITSWTDTSDGGYFPTDSWNSVEFMIRGLLYSFKGRIPPYFKGIDVSSNKLTGKIPIQMTRLTEIIILNMSNNLLTGQIPSSLANLKQVESLDLSHNNLSGGIPPELTELLSLLDFNVSFNNLSGMLPPLKAQFSTFDESSYWGNPGLCGVPLKMKCNGSAETPAFYASAEKLDISCIFCCFGMIFFLLLSFCVQ